MDKGAYKILKKLAKMLIHPLIGKLIGIAFILLPLVVIIRNITLEEIYRINLFSIIYFIFLTYLGLFFGGYFHEVGHIITLRLMGCDCKIRVMKNSHSKIIFFNMKTEIIKDNPINSTSNRLIIRALSGMASNIVFNLIFIYLGIITKRIDFLYLALIQGFSGHGATSLANVEGDTDVHSLRKALFIEDSIVAEYKLINNIYRVLLHLNLHIVYNLPENYWILVRNTKISNTYSNFINFDLGGSSIFIIPEPKSQTYAVEFDVENIENLVLITRTGKKIVFQENDWGIGNVASFFNEKFCST